MRDPSGVTDVFRQEWPRLVATLVKDVGDLEIAEESVQDAFVEAATRWERSGRPDRPGAWLLTTARRKAIDRARRSARWRDRIPELERQAGQEPDLASHDLIDDQLALLMGCCHPALSPDAQTALTLRIVAGLSTAQIARAFLTSEATMTRRLTRSKTKIREARIPFRVGDRATLVQRLGPVCGVIYSIFTEGHAMGRAGPYQFQAAIAALHATAPSVDETDWPAVVRLQLDRRAEAADCFRSAIEVCRNDAEVTHLRARLSVAAAPH